MGFHRRRICLRWSTSRHPTIPVAARVLAYVFVFFVTGLMLFFTAGFFMLHTHRIIMVETSLAIEADLPSVTLLSWDQPATLDQTLSSDDEKQPPNHVRPCRCLHPAARPPAPSMPLVSPPPSAAS